MLRFLWIGAQLLCIPLAFRLRYRLFFLYLSSSLLTALFYQPLTDHWGKRFAWALWMVLICRVASLLEALHYQTWKFKFWPFLVPGSWLISAAAVAGLWMASNAPFPSGVVETRRYVHLWLGLVSVATLLFFRLVPGAWRNLKTTRHTILVSMMVWNHEVVGLLSINGPWNLPKWKQANWWSMLIDLALLVGWAAAFPGSVKSGSPSSAAPLRPASSPGVPLA